MGKKEKILIVDDTIDTVELLTKRFRAQGYDTAAAYDGEEALLQVREYAPDIILLDVMMPKLDGYEVCRRLKKDETTKHIPILMLTAKSEVPDKVKGLDTGADGYLTKPFDYKELAARVRSLLARKDASSKQAEQEKLAALDQMVDEVSHEVRNPLVTIGGFARRVRDNLAADDPNIKYLDIILQNVEALEKMVAKLLALKSATLSYTETADMNEIIRLALVRNNSQIRDGKITVETRLMENPPRIPADRDNLATAISCIIENGIEAMENRPGKKLTIATGMHNGFFEIEIRDTGKGISRDMIKNIYDPFSTSKIYGPGLGLTFALKTIQNHKGMISVQSEVDKGSSFTIRLPLKPAGPPHVEKP